VPDTAAPPVEPSTDPPASLEATRRRLSPRQAEVVLSLVQATSDEIVEVGYAGLTVRSVARRAGVAPATAYNYFSSKDHLLAEVLWRHMQALPPAEGPGRRSMKVRLTEAVRDMVLFTAESPALVDACTVALLSANPDVKHLRDRIGAQIHRRLATVVGADVDPLVVRVLETSFMGSLLAAGTGHMAFADIPRLMAAAADLMVATGPSSITPTSGGRP
jgi:AcrR family transcriptional regulator